MQSALIVIFASVLVLAQSATTPQQLHDKVKDVAKKCAVSNKLPEDKSKIIFTQEIPATENERCLIECVYRGLDLVTEQKFNVEGAKKLITVRFTGKEADLANKLVDTCSKEIVAKPDEKCSLGKSVRECFAKNGKEVNFFPNQF